MPKTLSDITNERRQYTERSWAEDFYLENGHYENICADCGEHFAGQKGRVVCRQCANH